MDKDRSLYGNGHWNLVQSEVMTEQLNRYMQYEEAQNASSCFLSLL